VSSGRDRWRALRVEFPLAARLTYLDVPAGLPLSRRAAEAGQRYFAEMLGGDGVARHGPDPEFARLRARLAGILDVPADDLLLTGSVAAGLGLVAGMLAPGAHVVVMADEEREVPDAVARRGHRLSRVPSQSDGTVAMADVERALRPETRMVLTGTILRETGFRHDLESLAALCRSRGVWLAADASPSFGLVPLDVRAWAPDILVCGLAGGPAVVYRQPRLAHLIAAPALAPDVAQIAGLRALGGALDLLVETDPGDVDARVHELTAYLHRRLDAAGFRVRSPRARAQRAHVTIIDVADPGTVTTRLADAGILVAPCARGLRVSLHVCTLEPDLDHLVSALECLRRGETRPARVSPAGPLVCVDLNGVLDAYEGWRGPDHWDPPRPGAREFLRQLRAAGCRVTVFTTRHYRGAWDWLLRHDMGTLVDEVTDRKPPADVFVDDRAVCFRGDFRAVLADVLAFTPHWREDAGSR
jgi:cysteine desulfurase / selenocysteine lyase